MDGPVDWGLAMIALRDIEMFTGKLADVYHPRRIVMFGSYAAGKMRQDSDVDLLVTFDSVSNRLRTVTEVITNLKPRFAVDLMIRTEQEVRDRLRENDGFMADIMKNGRVLYEKID